MAYTVGIKRRWIPGYRKVTVTGHDWQNWRFILNLADGSQEHIPGFTVGALKVYADFWTHLAQVERSRPTPPPVPQFRPVVPEPVVEARHEPVQSTVEVEEYQPPPRNDSPEMQEVRRRAANRVRSILASDGPH